MVFVIVFGGVAWLLWSMFGFELLHLMIFFIFLSGAELPWLPSLTNDP